MSLDAERRAVCTGITSCRARLARSAVHGLRVALRRLLSALDLAVAVGCEAKPRLGRRLKKLLRALSPLRDAHVQLRATKLLPDAQGRRLFAHLDHERHSHSREARKRLNAFDLSDFERDVSRVISGVDSAGQDSASRAAVEAALSGRLARGHLSIQRALRTAALGDARALHDLRLALKDYRYALDALAPCLPAPARELSLVVARLQDQLGLAHDAQVLAELARSELKSAKPELDELVQRLERESEAAQLQGAAAARDAELGWPFEARRG
jgi:CHAD domain-containing protein